MFDEIVEKILIERNKTVDNMISVEIQKIATENGIDTKIILNEKAIVSALEKQIPKKPTHIFDDDSAECPACGNANFEYGINNWGCKYCPDCGQALDWSENEEGGETDA